MVSLGGGRSAQLLSIVGTRPEAIKIAPIALAARRRSGVSHRILATGQHDLLFDDALAGFELTPDLRLGPLIRESEPDSMVERLTAAIEPVLRKAAPDLVRWSRATRTARSPAPLLRAVWAFRWDMSRRGCVLSISSTPGRKSAIGC